jgi:16S rRNA (cytosine967-C5)-methyltransferase
MKESARLQTVIALLGKAMEPKPTDTMLSAYFRGHRFIGAKDRSAIAGRIYSILRHHARLNWWLKHLKYDPRGELELARAIALAYQALATATEHKSIVAMFDGSSHSPHPLNDEEKKLLSELKGRTLVHPEMPDAVRLECPEWAFDKMKATLGAGAEKELLAMQEEAPLDLRVNIVKTSRDVVLDKLRAAGIQAVATPHSALGVRVQGRPAIASLDIFKDGWIEIQDEGSQLAAQLVDAQPGMSVVDFCAGAGGKTLAIAAAMNNKGRVVACDVLGGRLKRARLRFRRAGLHNIEVRELSSESDDWVKRNSGKHDRVLVDAPCSGTGTWRRNPDARWKQLGPGLDELLATQARILKSAARLAKPGGRVIYATCSLLQDENQKQIEVFLKENPSFSLVQQGKKDYLVLSPANDKTDGFFAAVLEKK